MPDDVFLSRRQFLQASAAAALSANAVTAPSALAVGTSGKLSAAAYVVNRLSQHGAGILFGVPGATCDPLFAAAASADNMAVVVTSSDLEAGYAADGFARLRGLSALSVTYGVGTMSLLSVIGGAYVERSPIVVVNGGPSKLDLKLQHEQQTLFSHSTGRERTDLTMFREITALAQRAESRDEVPRLVDEAIGTALRERRPVYIEIAKDVWDAAVAAPSAPLRTAPSPSGHESELATQIMARLSQAKRPVLLLGIELQRYGLAESATALVRKLGIPYATTMLAKSVIAETTPGFGGVYIGTSSVPAVRELVEHADVVLALGCVFGRQYRDLVTKSASALVAATNGQVRLGDQSIAATLGVLLEALLAAPHTTRPEHMARNTLGGRDFAARRASVPRKATVALTYDGVLGVISDYLDDTFAVVTDTSLSMYPAADLNVPAHGVFVCNSVWQAIGFSVGAALGVALASSKRPLVICGDGGFQMTVQALSSMARAGLKSIVIVLDNGLYGIEQFLLEPQFFTSTQARPLPYVGLHRWRYADVARAMGFEHAEAVTSIAELQKALDEARGADGPVLLSVTIPPRDLPAQLVKEPS